MIWVGDLGSGSLLFTHPGSWIRIRNNAAKPGPYIPFSLSFTSFPANRAMLYNTVYTHPSADIKQMLPMIKPPTPSTGSYSNVY